jgi:hypothetical protein
LVLVLVNLIQEQVYLANRLEEQSHQPLFIHPLSVFINYWFTTF